MNKRRIDRGIIYWSFLGYFTDDGKVRDEEGRILEVLEKAKENNINKDGIKRKEMRSKVGRQKKAVEGKVWKINFEQ